MPARHPNITPAQRPFRAPALRHWILLGLTCVGMLFWLKTHIGFVIVDGDSMLPTFESGDLLLIHKRAYRHIEPARGDIVVARFRSELIVKRIVGLPGETVEVVSGGVHVNTEAIPELYPLQPGVLEVHPGELMPERYAVLGDNRAGSEYQLFFAVIPYDGIVGRARLAFRLRRAGLSVWVPPTPQPHPPIRIDSDEIDGVHARTLRRKEKPQKGRIGTFQAPKPFGSRTLTGAVLIFGRSFLASSRLCVRPI